jgi:hypothetical protein
MKRIVWLLLISLVSLTSWSQNMKISGTIYDTSGTKPLPDAIAMAVRIKDSVLLDYALSDKQGKFSLSKVPIDTFTLMISHFRFDDKTYYIFGSQENQEINIQNIHLGLKTKELAEVVVYANKNPIYFRGDTLVYVADSFKVGQNAVVEDLLKKLPGITVDEDGKIKAQGKEISKVFVDGDEFFGTDPTIATKNLGASGVETVEVYEKKNENAAEGEDETIQIMDLKLKEEAKKGYFGRISGASDLTQFYEGEMLFNRFDGTQKLAVFVLSSNTPRSKFDWGDINKFGLDEEIGYSQNEDGDWMQKGSSMSGNGIPQTLRSGIYFSDKIGKKKRTKVGFNYSYLNYQLNALSQSYSQYFLSDTSYYSADSTRTISKNEAHTANFTFFSQIDSLTTLEIKPSFQFSKGSTIVSDYSHFLASNALAARSNNISRGNNSDGLSTNSEINFTRDFKKERRSLTILHKFNYGNNATDGNLYSENTYYIGTSSSDTLNQLKTNQNTNHVQTLKATYYEPITKKWKLETEYMFEYSKNEQAKEARNILSETVAEVDSNFTNSFETTRFQHRVGLAAIYESRKHTLTIGTRARTIQIDNYNIYTANSITQNITNILPRLSYTFKLSKTSNLSTRYNTSSSQPSVNSLQPIPDNTNPNRVQIGNPDLKPNYSHRVSFNYNSWNAVTNRNIWSGANFNYSNNAMVDSTIFDADGRQFIKTVNADGNLWSNIYVGSGIGLYKKILEINPGLNASYSKSISYINGLKNERSSLGINLNFGINFNLDSMSLSTYSTFGRTSPSSTINSSTNQPFTTQEHQVYFSWTLPFWHITLKSDASYFVNGQRTDGYNLNYFIWNASIDKAFMKTENLIISLQGNDMLNQNIIAQRSINSNIITDYKTKIISRYFLVKLTVKFNNKKEKEEDNDWN